MSGDRTPLPPDRRADERLADYLLGWLPDAERAALEAELEASPELRRRAAQLRRVLFSLPQALPEEPPDAGAWERLQERLRERRGGDLGAGDPATTEPTAGPTPADAAVGDPTGVPTGVPTGGPTGGPRAPVPPDGAPPARRGAAPRRSPGRGGLRGWGTRGALGLSLALAVVLLLATGAWGWQRARDVARLQREQRIVAYWMRNPDMRLTRLEPLSDVRAGVLCVLPDGRAMVLQPDPAPRGAQWALYGEDDAGRREVARTTGRLLLFRTDGLDAVELVRVGGGAPITVALASLR